MQELTPILEFTDVTLRSVAAPVSGVAGLALSLKRGELALVELEEGREHSPLAPLAQGLVAPDSGRILFDGEDWAAMGPARVSWQRGRIRRVYEHYGWITNLDVIENICLAECYHTSRPVEAIVQEAQAMARRFGIDPIPDARPTRVHHMTLRKLEWVRAFIGTPELIILERPLFGAPKADAKHLIAAVCEVLGKGVAVLWMAENSHVFDCQAWDRVSRFRMQGERMVAA